MGLDRFKKIGINTAKDITNVTKDQFDKIKVDYDHDKNIRERKEMLEALDDVLYEKYKQIQQENDYFELIKGRVTIVKEYDGKDISEEKLNDELIQRSTEIFETQRIRKHFSEDVQRKILKKQNYNCNVCNSFLTTMDFDHIDGDRSNNSMDNCQALCSRCHRMKSAEENSNRK